MRQSFLISSKKPKDFQIPGGDIVVEFYNWLCGFHDHTSIPDPIPYTLTSEALCFCIHEDVNQIGSFIS
jgi:hypothetical protein